MLYTKSALEAHADKAAIETAWDPRKPGFYFLTRAAVLDLTASQLQRMQEMRDSKLLVKVLIDLNDAFQGKGLIESVLFVSHRWEDPATPDETGAQLAAIKAHLLDHPEIQFVWFDYSCMPQRSSGLSPDQDDRTPAEKAEFDLMLKSIADLYLTAKVLILLDTMYRTRFWTTMEGWCAMQKVTPQGVRPARAGESRVTVVCIHNATQHDERALLEMSTKTAEEITKFLASPDVAVTNKKDKTTMLPIVGKTDERVREMMSGMHSVIPESHEEELREDDNPITLFIDSARERVGSLFGITPLVMEREGATTGNAAASELHVQIPVRASSAPEPFYQGFHPGITCGRSGMNPIVGMRFHLRGIEPSSDLCQAEYDKLDDAENGLYEAIPPPPPGLKLEGGSLPGYAADYPGTYRLADGKLVNGRPAYQHTTDATLWIAFDGVDSWMGQPESLLGEKKGFLGLRDRAAASPDVSAKTWKASGGAGAGWVEAPQLKCTAWTPPPLPPGLKLEGGSLRGVAAKYMALPGEAAKYMGGYRLVVGKLVNGRPAYQHTSDATLWITFAGNGWIGQPESALGEEKGNLDLRDPAAASPDVSAKTWMATAGGADNPWVEAPQLKCTAWTPPALLHGLKLEGGSLPGGAAEYMGGFRLADGKLVNGRPAYQHVTDGSRWLAFDGAIWRGQTVADLGQKRGVLQLPDEAAATPDASAAPWLCGWAPQPQLQCIPWTPPPLSPGLKLEGGSLAGAAAEYMGGYRLDRSRPVNGRPAYQHMAHLTRWLAFDGAIWRGQPEADLGKKRGVLQLPDTAALTPDASAATWLAETGSGLAAQPQLKCIPCIPPPPPGLKLEGGSLGGGASEYMGGYSLYSGKLVNGRPAWRHTTHFTCWLAFDGAIWRGQPEADLGQKRGFLQLPDAGALTPDASAATWLAETGSGLAAQPQLKCIPCIPPPPPGLKLEGGSLGGGASEYMGGYRLADGKLVNGRPAYQQMTLGSSWAADGSRWIAFNGKDSWIGQSEADLGKGNGILLLLDAAAATPDVSTKTWKAWAGATGSGWVEEPPLKCIPWTPSPPPLSPGLKLEGGSLPGAAAEYMGEYRLVVDDRVGWPPQAVKAGWPGNHMLVNGRPAWRHTTHLKCWLAFDGAIWRGQPEASLGQKRGFLQLPDAGALTPDASAATWLAAGGPGSAGAAQPQLKCIPCAAPELSQVELKELPVKHFRGPCADCCKPLAPCCCVSADGEAIFGCVPTEPGYILPACLHMALCPQLGCDPKGGFLQLDCREFCFYTLLPFVCCCQIFAPPRFSFFW